jgi:hypothetical protein
MIWRDRLNPIPVPFSLVVKKGMKTWSKSSGGMPLPLSFTCKTGFPDPPLNASN